MSGPLTPIPGSYGLPLIGRVAQTLEFFVFGGWRDFFVRRQARHGSVFRVNLWQPTIAILDPVAIAPLFDAGDLHQDYGFSWAVPPKALTGGVVPSIFLNGAEHAAWKGLVMALIDARRGDLKPAFDRRYGAALADWRARGSFAWGEEIERATAGFVFDWLLGATPDPDDVRCVYNTIFNQPLPGIARLFPNSAYSKALRAYPRLVAAVRASPGFAQAADLAIAAGISDGDALAHRLVFMAGMNAFLGTQGMVKIIVGELTRQPGLTDRLRTERAGEGGDWPSIARRAQLDAALREMLRLHPPVSFVFGRATAPRLIEAGGRRYAVKQGELLMGVIPFVQEDATLFSDPHAFDLDRHLAGPRPGLIWARGEQDCAVVPTDRVCPGKDPAVLVGKVMIDALLDHRWTLAEPPVWDDRKFSLNVAAPKGPLTVTGFALA